MQKFNKKTFKKLATANFDEKFQKKKIFKYSNKRQETSK